ncbi:MAG: xanthine dehydrogenase family protein subunit M [Halobacteriaceae archaeon]
MKPAPFEYHQPGTVGEATDLLADLGTDAELMAGNQSLGIIMSNRLATPDHIIDINGIDDIAGVDIDEDTIHVGAMTRHRTLEDHDDLRDALAVLPEAAEQIAGPSVRNRGTLGGSIGEADPAGNYPAVLRALDADIHVTSAESERTIPAEEYFIAYMFTEREEDELITGVSIDRDPFPPDRTGSVFLELKRAAQTFPTVGAAATVRVEDPTVETPVIEDVRVALSGVAGVPLRVPDAESNLVGSPAEDAALDALGDALAEAADPESEQHASEAFKREVAAEYARRAVSTAYDRARA